MPTLKITGVDEEVAKFVVARSSSLHFKGQAEYLRNLIREDMLRAAKEKKSRLEEILAPLHAHAEAQGYTESELAKVFEKAREQVATAKTGRTASRHKLKK